MSPLMRQSLAWRSTRGLKDATRPVGIRMMMTPKTKIPPRHHGVHQDGCLAQRNRRARSMDFTIRITRLEGDASNATRLEDAPRSSATHKPARIVGARYIHTHSLAAPANPAEIQSNTLATHLRKRAFCAQLTPSG